MQKRAKGSLVREPIRRGYFRPDEAIGKVFSFGRVGLKIMLLDSDEERLEGLIVKGDQRIEVASLSVDGLVARNQYQRQSRASDKAPEAEDGGGYQQ